MRVDMRKYCFAERANVTDLVTRESDCRRAEILLQIRKNLPNSTVVWSSNSNLKR